MAEWLKRGFGLHLWANRQEDLGGGRPLPFNQLMGVKRLPVFCCQGFLSGMCAHDFHVVRLPSYVDRLLKSESRPTLVRCVFIIESRSLLAEFHWRWPHTSVSR